jgi:hypothetical protein
MAELMASIEKIEEENAGSYTENKLLKDGMALLVQSSIANKGKPVLDMQVARLCILVCGLFVSQAFQDYSRGKLKAKKTLELGKAYIDSIAVDVELMSEDIMPRNLYNTSDYSVDITPVEDAIDVVLGTVGMSYKNLEKKVVFNEEFGRHAVIRRVLGKLDSDIDVIKYRAERLRDEKRKGMNETNRLVITMAEGRKVKKKRIEEPRNNGMEWMLSLSEILRLWEVLIEEIGDSKEWIDVGRLIAGKIVNWAAEPLIIDEDEDEDCSYNDKIYFKEIEELIDWLYAALESILSEEIVEDEFEGDEIVPDLQ